MEPNEITRVRLVLQEAVEVDEIAEQVEAEQESIESSHMLSLLLPCDPVVRRTQEAEVEEVEPVEPVEIEPEVQIFIKFGLCYFVFFEEYGKMSKASQKAHWNGQKFCAHSVPLLLFP